MGVLRKHNAPYEMGVAVAERKHVKDMLSFIHA